MKHARIGVAKQKIIKHGCISKKFAAEYHDHKEQDNVKTAQSKFHSANYAVDITQALDNLAMAAISHRDIFA